MTRENRAEVIYNDLGDDFIQTIAQRDGSVVIKAGWGVRIWNEGNESRVDSIVQRPRQSALFHYLQQILSKEVIESEVEFNGPTILSQALVLFEPF